MIELKEIEAQLERLEKQFRILNGLTGAARKDTSGERIAVIARIVSLQQLMGAIENRNNLTGSIIPPNGGVGIGSTITVRYLSICGSNADETVTVTIVDGGADPKEGTISSETKLAQCVMGLREADMGQIIPLGPGTEIVFLGADNIKPITPNEEPVFSKGSR